MAVTVHSCPECGADWHTGTTCQDHFHQMLAWEFEDLAAGAVHHLTVLCYYIQHPSLLSPEGLAHQKALLKTFVEEGISPVEARHLQRDEVDSGRRTWSFKPGDQPATHASSIRWDMTTGDAAGENLEGYATRVHAWARSVLAALEAAEG